MSDYLINAGRLPVEITGAPQPPQAPVVFLHGFSLDRRLWADQTAALAGAFQTIAYDLRGFGGASLPDGPFRHADDLLALLDQLQIERAHLVGLSLGGGLALDFCLAHPGRVRTLTLVDATLGGFTWAKDWGEPTRAARAQGVAAARAVWLADELFAPALAQPAAAARLRQMVADYSGWHWLNRSPELPPAGEPALNRLGEIRAPALVIAGELDTVEFRQIADLLARAIPGARRASLAGVGHLPNLEAPERFNALLREFLDQRP